MEEATLPGQRLLLSWFGVGVNRSGKQIMLAVTHRTETDAHSPVALRPDGAAAKVLSGAGDGDRLAPLSGPVRLDKQLIAILRRVVSLEVARLLHERWGLDPAVFFLHRVTDVCHPERSVGT